jgi:hypothetical protein
MRDQCTIEPDYMDFLNSETFSQLVISESAASCFMNTWAGSNIGKFDLDEEKINLLFEMDDLKFDTSAISSQIPLF